MGTLVSNNVVAREMPPKEHGVVRARCYRVTSILYLSVMGRLVAISLAARDTPSKDSNEVVCWHTMEGKMPRYGFTHVDIGNVLKMKTCAYAPSTLHLLICKKLSVRMNQVHCCKARNECRGFLEAQRALITRSILSPHSSVYAGSPAIWHRRSLGRDDAWLTLVGHTPF